MTGCSTTGTVIGARTATGRVGAEVSRAARRAGRRPSRGWCAGTRATSASDVRRPAGPAHGTRRGRSARPGGGAPAGIVPSAARTRWPSTVQPGRFGRGAVAASTASRPRNSQPVRDGHPGHRQLRQRRRGSRGTPGGPAVAGRPSGAAGRRGRRRPAGQHPPGPGLDEDPGPGRVHRLDLLDEPDRRADLGGQLAADRVRVGGVRRGRAVGPHRDGGRARRPIASSARPNASPRGGHQRAVERARDRDPLRAEPGRRAGGPTAASTPAVGPEITICVGRVVVGQHDLAGEPGVGEHLADLPRRRPRPRPSCPGRPPAPRRGSPPARACAERRSRARRRRTRRPRTARPARRSCARRPCRGPDAERGQQLVARPARRRRGRAGRRGCRVTRSASCLPRPLAERGRREERRRPSRRAEPQVPLQLGEGDEQVGEHARPLAALAGEQERDARRRSGVGRAGQPGRGSCSPAECPPQQRGQVVHVAGDDRDPDRPPGRFGPPGAAARREVAQPPRLAGPPGQCPAGRHRAAGRVRGLRRGSVNSSAGHSSAARARGGTPSCAREHHVEVGAAEAERADPGEPLGRRRRPRARRRRGTRTGWSPDPRPGSGSSRCSVGGWTPVCSASAALISPARPAAHLVCPICDFTEPSAQPPGAAPASVNTFGQRAQFGAVADDGAGAVRLDQPDLARARRRRCGRRGPARARWPSGPRRGQAERPAVAGRADALDHRVDPVAVALGVGEALEHHAGDALAERDAVGRAVERRATARSATARAPRRTAGSR